MSILGNRVLRKEDPKFLTTGAVYAADTYGQRLQKFVPAAASPTQAAAR